MIIVFDIANSNTSMDISLLMFDMVLATRISRGILRTSLYNINGVANNVAGAISANDKDVIEYSMAKRLNNRITALAWDPQFHISKALIQLPGKFVYLIPV